jgi:hypothetical protein
MCVTETPQRSAPAWRALDMRAVRVTRPV